MQVAWLVGLFAALVGVGGCERSITDADIQMIGVDEVRRLVEAQREGKQDSVVLIDARPPARYADGHLPGAINLELPDLDRRGRGDRRLAGRDHLIVYGQDPADAPARAMTKRLMELDYDGVRMYAGGLAEWRARGLPVEGAASSPQPDPAASP